MVEVGGLRIRNETEDAKHRIIRRFESFLAH